MLDDAELTGGNLLDFSPEYGWITWIGQVMPLLFFVGGFASATSLRSAETFGGSALDRWCSWARSNTPTTSPIEPRPDRRERRPGGGRCERAAHRGRDRLDTVQPFNEDPHVQVDAAAFAA